MGGRARETSRKPLSRASRRKIDWEMARAVTTARVAPPEGQYPRRMHVGATGPSLEEPRPGLRGLRSGMSDGGDQQREASEVLVVQEASSGGRVEGCPEVSETKQFHLTPLSSSVASYLPCSSLCPRRRSHEQYRSLTHTTLVAHRRQMISCHFLGEISTSTSLSKPSSIQGAPRRPLPRHGPQPSRPRRRCRRQPFAPQRDRIGWPVGRERRRG